MTRERKRNALSDALVTAVVGALDDARREKQSIVVISAAGPVFTAGADTTQGLTETAPSVRLVEYARSYPLLLVAKIAGPVYGAGASLVAACPVAFAAEDVIFALPEIRHGLFPTGVLTDLVPFVPARRLLDVGLTGGSLSAEEACIGGLISRLCPPDELDATTGAWVQNAVRHPDLVVEARRFFDAAEGAATYPPNEEFV